MVLNPKSTRRGCILACGHDIRLWHDALQPQEAWYCMNILCTTTTKQNQSTGTNTNTHRSAPHTSRALVQQACSHYCDYYYSMVYTTPRACLVLNCNKVRNWSDSGMFRTANLFLLLWVWYVVITVLAWWSHANGQQVRSGAKRNDERQIFSTPLSLRQHDDDN